MKALIASAALLLLSTLPAAAEGERTSVAAPASDASGAVPSTGMTHIAFQETAGGRNVEWREKVTDDQYGR